MARFLCPLPRLSAANLLLSPLTLLMAAACGRQRRPFAVCGRLRQPFTATAACGGRLRPQGGASRRQGGLRPSQQQPQPGAPHQSFEASAKAFYFLSLTLLTAAAVEVRSR